MAENVRADESRRSVAVAGIRALVVNQQDILDLVRHDPETHRHRRLREVFGHGRASHSDGAGVHRDAKSSIVISPAGLHLAGLCRHRNRHPGQRLEPAVSPHRYRDLRAADVGQRCDEDQGCSIPCRLSRAGCHQAGGRCRSVGRRWGRRLAHSRLTQAACRQSEACCQQEQDAEITPGARPALGRSWRFRRQMLASLLSPQQQHKGEYQENARPMRR